MRFVSPVVCAVRGQQEEQHRDQRQEFSIAGVLHAIVQLLPECHPIILALQSSHQ